MRMNQAAIHLAQKNARRVEKKALEIQRQQERAKQRNKRMDVLTFTLLFILWILLIVIIRGTYL